MNNRSSPWRLDQIAAHDARRADAVRAAPSREALATMTSAALRAGLSDGSLHVGLDESELTGEHLRAVLQFRVGQQLFDWFFNTRTGYRAQFRERWQNGLSYNNELIRLLRYEIKAAGRKTRPAGRLSTWLEDLGPVAVTVERILTSLDPHLSKVWFCTKLVQQNGVVSDLRVELAGPRIVFDEYDSWSAPFPEESHAWLDLKGAFMGDDGLYQIKDPVRRAKDIQRLGSA